jgi:hypothetical protein
MITFLLELLRLLPFLVGGHRQLALENLALRQQLAVYKRTAPWPKLRTMDRLFWVGLARAWTGWRQAGKLEGHGESRDTKGERVEPAFLQASPSSRLA